MDIERLVQHYLDHLDHADLLKEKIEEFKQALIEVLIKEGDVDDKGHQVLAAGKYFVQRQRRETKPTLDLSRAESWAKELGIWDKVSRTVEVLDEDALLGYVFEHQDLESEFQKLFNAPKISYALMRPTEVKTYEY